jgi:hypothetical protein
VVDGVGVHEAEGADTRGGEVEVHRGAEAAEADDKGSVLEIIGGGGGGGKGKGKGKGKGLPGG